MRLFIAIEMPDPVRQHLAGVQEALRRVASEASWTREANLHLTLKFLWGVPDPQVPQVCDALKALAITTQPMRLAATGMECFPERGPIRVIGAKIEGDDERLRDLVEQIEQRCFEIGFRKEGRVYRPHITLARARRPLPGSVRGEFDAVTGTLWPGPGARVERFALIQSKLDPKGSQYTPIAHFGVP